MKLRERWLPLAVIALLVVCCTALLSCGLRHATGSSTAVPGANPLPAVFKRRRAGKRCSPRAVLLAAANFRSYNISAGGRHDRAKRCFSCLAALRSAKVLPEKYLDAADVLIAQTAEYSVGSEANGMTTYHFRQSADGPYLNFTLSEYGVLTNLSGSLGLREGFVSADVAKAYRTMLGLNVFTDWVDAEPHGYGTPAPYYSADAQLYLVANMDRGYFSLSVTSMAPETYAGL